MLSSLKSWQELSKGSSETYLSLAFVGLACYHIANMLGFSDIWILGGYTLPVLAFLFCLVYGIINWRKGIEEKDGDYREEIHWEKEEIELIEKLP